MAVLYTPHFIQFFDNNGDPLNGGLLYTYAAGTTTPKATFTTAAGDVSNANPIVLDSSGRAVIFIDGAYKFRLETSTGALVRETDNIDSFEVASASATAINWNTADTLASAATVDIGAATSNYVIITGTTTITSFGTIAQGAERILRFTGSLQITHNATSMILFGGANITTQAGDTCRVISEGGGNWRLLSYQRASGALTNIATSKTANYTATTADDLIPCDATSGAFTVTLYSASGNAGHEITIKKTDSTFNVVTIDANASETIDGALTRRLCTQNEAITLACDGTNWYVKDRVIPSIWTTYTTTISHSSGGITNNTNSFRYRRNGDSIEIMGTIAFSAASAAFTGLFATIPSGLTIDSGKMTTATNFIQTLGQVNFLDSGVSTYRGDVLYVASSGGLEIQYNIASTANVTGGSTTNAAPFTYGASDAIGITTHRIPITNWEG